MRRTAERRVAPRGAPPLTGAEGPLRLRVPLAPMPPLKEMAAPIAKKPTMIIDPGRQQMAKRQSWPHPQRRGGGPQLGTAYGPPREAVSDAWLWTP